MSFSEWLIYQTTLRDKPVSGKIAAYLPGGMLVSRLEGDTTGVCQILTSTHKTGYVSVDLLERYVPVFDYSQEIIRVPQDNEIYAAIDNGRAAQYLLLTENNRKRVHYNLCGQFCAAAIAGLDVLPFLDWWLSNVPSAKRIMDGDKTTGTSDLINMLRSFGVDGIVRNFSYNDPASPGKVSRHLPAIVGIGINSSGLITKGGSIRHWGVATEIFPISNTAFVRVYNPFWNREEEILFCELLENNGRITIVEVDYV